MSNVPTQGRLQIAVYSGDTFVVYPLDPGGRLTIGRSDENDVRISEAAVSRRHAVLHAGPPLQIEDLGGANATYLSRAALHAGGETLNLSRLSGERATLEIGDVMNFGGAMAVVRRAPGQGAAAAPVSDEAIVRDPATVHVYEQAKRAAQGSLAVLILGETGVGKDVLARALHRESPRAARPFLAINCAALSESLLESELFGHEKGAFTGAIQARPGLFESADGGTVFLDEIGDLPMVIQVKLLRVLEQKEVMRVGARTPRPVDVRFVSATNRDLESASTAGTFRQDLYFRLNGISLTIPPLRERPGDLPWLVKRFLAMASRQLDRATPPTLAPATLAALQAYPWPGNIRELRNAVERAVVLAGGDVLLPEHLPAKIASFRASDANANASPSPTALRPATTAADPAPNYAVTAVFSGGAAPITDHAERLRREMGDVERKRILDALAACDGNQTKAADLLGVSRRTLINRLVEYDLPRPRKR